MLASIPVALVLSPFAIALGALVLLIAAIVLKVVAPAIKIFNSLSRISIGLAAVLALCALAGVLSDRTIKALVQLAYAYILAEAHSKQVSK